MISTNELDWGLKHHCEESFFGSIVIARSYFSGDEAIQESYLDCFVAAKLLLAMTFKLGDKYISLILCELPRYIGSGGKF